MYSIKRLFRREPVVSTVVTAGGVNVILGTLEGQALLAFLGVLAVSGTIALRSWQQAHHRPIELPEPLPLRYLPEQSARPAMPMMGHEPRRPSPDRE